jgi:hypothetical protein
MRARSAGFPQAGASVPPPARRGPVVPGACRAQAPRPLSRQWCRSARGAWPTDAHVAAASGDRSRSRISHRATAAPAAGCHARSACSAPRAPRFHRRDARRGARSAARGRSDRPRHGPRGLRPPGKPGPGSGGRIQRGTDGSRASGSHTATRPGRARSAARLAPRLSDRVRPRRKRRGPPPPDRGPAGRARSPRRSPAPAVLAAPRRASAARICARRASRRRARAAAIACTRGHVDPAGASHRLPVGRHGERGRPRSHGLRRRSFRLLRQPAAVPGMCDPVHDDP